MASIGGVSFRQTDTGLSVRVYRSNKSSSSGKAKKRLPYNFKQMSKQIQAARTSSTARPVVTKMRAKLSWLYKQLRTGDYGTSEVFAAIIHAASMERIAKRKVRHLEEEEAAENGNSAGGAPGEEEIFGKDELVEALEENEELSEKMLEEMMQEMEELEEELSEDALSEMQDMAVYSGRDMTEEEIKEMKRNHRDDEERQMTRADLKYLKALFDRLEQEKRATSQTAAIYKVQSMNPSPAVSSYPAESLPETEIANVDVDMTSSLDVAL